MLTQAVATYLDVRRAAGFALKSEGVQLKSFAAFSEARGQHYVTSDIAIEWAGLARSISQRARRLGTLIRFARYLRAEDEHHAVPPAVFGAEKLPRPTPHILTAEHVRQIIDAASRSGYRTLRRTTYSTLFSLLACTGLRVSEAIRLRFDDITPDGLVIRVTKFRKSRLVPLHVTAQAGLSGTFRSDDPMPRSTITCSCHCEESHSGWPMWKPPSILLRTESGCHMGPGALVPRRTPCGTHSRSEPSKPALMAVTLSANTCWRYRPSLAIARWPTPIGIWKPCQI